MHVTSEIEFGLRDWYRRQAEFADRRARIPRADPVGRNLPTAADERDNHDHASARTSLCAAR